jgi:xanthine/CO dehydrogenase XdhC/CoxF family maturation factor
MLFVIAMVQTIAHALFGAYTDAHAIENSAARTSVDTHVLDNTAMQNCCYHTQLQLL